MFESVPTSNTMSNNNEIPFECVSTEGNYVLNGLPYLNYDDNCNESCHPGALIQPPSEQSMMAAIQDRFVNCPWHPGLNSIPEETTFDIQFEGEKLLPTNSTSRKKVQYQQRQRRQHYAKISKAINQKGIYRAQLEPAQEDNGANRTCTNNKSLLVHYEDISPYPIHGVNSDGPALHCVGKGYLPWKNSRGQLLMIRCYYSPSISGTIISPNDVVVQYGNKYSGYEITNDFDSKTGTCRFIARDGCTHIEFETYMENNLWFHYLNPLKSDEQRQVSKQIKSTMNQLNDVALYELWHHRLGHPGQKVMESIHRAVTGVPQLKKHKFYSCRACNSAKFRRNHIGPKKKSAPSQPSQDETYEVGQHLHIDFGFVRGKDWAKKTTDNKLVTSIDNCRAYCLVIDRRSRYIWVFHTRTKDPPIEQLKGLLDQLKAKVSTTYKTVTTDNGGELAKSHAFQKMIDESGYILKTTGAFSSAQNGLAERPNQDLGRMMRALLYSSGKGSEYWTYALRHATYLKNRLPHSALNMVTPYEIVNNEKPDLSHLRVFGSRVHYQKQKKGMKLDRIDGTGTFMTYKGTPKVFYVIDNTTKKENTVTHGIFDEAYMSVPKSLQPPMAGALQQAGYQPRKEKRTLEIPVEMLDTDVKPPKRATSGSAGFDVYSGESITIEPGKQMKISTKLKMAIPPGYYGQLLVRSGFAAKFRARVEAGTIDSDYRGEVFVLMSNNGNKPIVINKNDRFAQLVLHNANHATIVPSEHLNNTQRGSGGFGSTGVKDKTQQPKVSTLIFDESVEPDVRDLEDEPLYNVHLSQNPYLDIIQVKMGTQGNHPTKGLQLQSCPKYKDKVIINTCLQGTPAAKLKNWSKWIKRCVLLKIDDCVVDSIESATKYLSNVGKDCEVTLHIGTTERRALHPSTGIPMMFFDQLVTISQHLQQIKNGDEDKTLNGQKMEPPNHSTVDQICKACQNIQPTIVNILQQILPKSKMKSKKLTRKKLKNGNDWERWNGSEFKQLQQYEDQDTFGIPCPLPPNANCLNLLWAYSIKEDGTLKARCVCNGQPSNKNTVIFGYTYAKALDQVGAKIFWSAVALKNMTVRGADASNAFAEADPPKVPLYVRIDQQFREWWRSKGRGEIPLNYVLPVKRALQGHPEAPRAWATKIDGILKHKLKLRPTTHEPCLYHGIYKGKEILFLRQVDDFAVGCTDDNLSKEIIDIIDTEMSIDIKDLGLVNRFNGVDITQTRDYVKISNATYINKIINEHPIMFRDYYPANVPIPASDDRNFAKMLETAVPPESPEQQRLLQVEMGFNYRQAVGELIFAMVTCRPDISFPLIKLSQYSKNPAKEHYQAIVNIFRYLQGTVDRGIHYWRQQPNNNFAQPEPPAPHKQTHIGQHVTRDPPRTLIAMVDSDWAGDTSHRKSVTGMVLKVANGAILHKTKYQDTIALSSTEAEFAAACEAGKSILYVRSILNEIQVDQTNATTLHIDNNGALLMGNAQQPTRRTKHVDIKRFALLDWVEHDLMIMKRINTADNCADSMTKSLGRILHYRHFDYVMGYHRPEYYSTATIKGQSH